MIDLKIIKENPKRIEAELEKRSIKLDVKKLQKLDADRRRLQQEFDTVRAEQKKVKTAADGKKIKEKLQKIEKSLKKVQKDFDDLYLQLPNFSADDVPEGEDESENDPIKDVGDQSIVDGAKPHYEIPAIKPLIDFERGAKVSGNRFWFLKGALVDLEFALLRYALDFYTKRGFVQMRPPTAVRESAMVGTGFFPAERSEIYEISDFVASLRALSIVHNEFPTEAKIKEMRDVIDDSELMDRFIAYWKKNSTIDDYQLVYEINQHLYERAEQLGIRYLSGTAEVPLASYHAGETLDELPIKYAGFAPAYRREAGSYGKDTKGIMRGHEFDKVELFVFASPDKSEDVHAELQKDAEEFWQSLEVPFRVVNICTGDLGAPNAKKLDIEVWLPGANRYMEVASNSNDTDFQARRLKIKHDGRLVHTLNNTAVAAGRAIIAIAENHQDKDGNVEIPKVLRKYLSFSRITADGTTS